MHVNTQHAPSSKVDLTKREHKVARGSFEEGLYENKILVFGAVSFVVKTGKFLHAD